MRKLFLAAGMMLAVSAQAEEFSVNIPELQAEAKGVIKQLVSTLGGELKKAKETGGAAAAITVCNTKALPLTQSVNETSGWEISRTSHKLRNPENTPDSWEKQVLEQFAAKANQGSNLQTLAFSQIVVDEEGRKIFRMMKAIPVGEQCLACHGSNVKPALNQKLQELYPEDKATGFAQGDLRGAFSLKKYL